MAPNRVGRIFVPTNPDLADILCRTDLNSKNVCFFFWFYDFLDPTFLDFRVPRSPNFWISRSPDLQIPRFPGPQISRFPDAAGAAAGRTLWSPPDPSPNAPRDQLRRKGPCRDIQGYYFLYVYVFVSSYGFFWGLRTGLDFNPMLMMISILFCAWS